MARGSIASGDGHTVFNLLQTLTMEMLQNGSRVGEQPETISARQVRTEMVDDLRAGYSFKACFSLFRSMYFSHLNLELLTVHLIMS